MSEELIANLQDAFSPFREVQPGESFYVDCKEVRGKDDMQDIEEGVNPLNSCG
jgi:hypothetical protein